MPALFSCKISHQVQSGHIHTFDVLTKEQNTKTKAYQIRQQSHLPFTYERLLPYTLVDQTPSCHAKRKAALFFFYLHSEAKHLSPARPGPGRLKQLDHVGDLRPEDLALLLERLNRLDEQLITIPLAQALDREDEVVLPPPQLNLALEHGVPQDLATDRVAHRVLHDGLQLALMALIAAFLPPRLLPRNALQPSDTLGEAVDELLGVGA